MLFDDTINTYQQNIYAYAHSALPLPCVASVDVANPLPLTYATLLFTQQPQQRKSPLQLKSKVRNSSTPLYKSHKFMRFRLHMRIPARHLQHIASHRTKQALPMYSLFSSLLSFEAKHNAIRLLRYRHVAYVQVAHIGGLP